MKIELRASKAQLSPTEDGLLKVSGYVNKTDAPSEVLGTTKKFIEKISKGAFDRAIKKAKEIDFLAEHNSEKLLASTRNGSLTLKEDSEGLWIEAIITPTTYGRDTYELIKSGIFKNMSFGFKSIKDSWQSIENGLFERTINELELFEVSVVKTPAYSQSTISARNLQIASADEIIKNIKLEKEEENLEITTYSLTDRYEETDTLQEQRNSDSTSFKDFLNEERTLQTTVEGTALAPISVADEVIKKVEENSPIFSNAKKLKSRAGTLKIAVENGKSGNAGFVGEGVSVKELALSLDEVKLEQKRVGAAISVSNQLINDAAIDIIEYSASLLGRRVAKVVENSMFTGTGSDDMNGIVHDEKVSSIDSLGVITPDNLLDLYNEVYVEYRHNAAFYVSASMYAIISKLRDASGHFYVQNGVVNGKPTRTLFGAPVYVTTSLKDAPSQIIFANAYEAVAVMIKQSAGLQLIVDTNNALKGVKTLIYDMYLDSAVVNYQAIAKLI